MGEVARSGPSDPTRREFLRNTGGTAAATAIAAWGVGAAPVLANSAAEQTGPPAANADGPNIEGAVPITLRINRTLSSSARLPTNPPATRSLCPPAYLVRL